MKATLLIAIAFVVFACQPEHPVTKRVDPNAPRTKELIKGYKLTATPTKDQFWEGEPVSLKLRVDTLASSPLSMFGGNLNLQEQVMLWRGNDQVSRELWNGQLITKSAKFNWHDPDGEGVMHLRLSRHKSDPFPPGNYRGFVDLVVTSNWFEFNVKPMPTDVRRTFDQVDSVTRADTQDLQVLIDLLGEVARHGPSDPLTRTMASDVLYKILNCTNCLEALSVDSAPLTSLASMWRSNDLEIDECDRVIQKLTNRIVERQQSHTHAEQIPE